MSVPINARNSSFPGAALRPLVLALACARGEAAPGSEPTAKGSDMNLYTLGAKTLEGKEQSLSEYEGKVTLS
jgi:hypothetical protein